MICMTYQETLDWMFNRLPMYQNQGASAYKKDLNNTLLLAEYLGNPEREVKTVHVAGTNGKGSTSNLLASILFEAGYKVGLYTSPHLKDFRERIKINGENISEKFVCNFIAENKSFFETNQLSFFEMTVGLAFDYFNKEKIDIAIIETGMGGRLDSTNIIQPLVSVITNIGLDHTQFLGNSLSAIAIEKAGIIKAGIPVVVGEYTVETKPVFQEKAQNAKSNIYFASDIVKADYVSALKGKYQEKNVKTVIQTINVLREHFSILEEHVDNGLKNIITNTHFMGRWQQIHKNPTAICDTAHNRHGLEIVLEQISSEKFDKLHIVLGVVNDKDLDDILPLFPRNAEYYFCKPNISRGLDSVILCNKAAEYKLNGKVYSSVLEAYGFALKNADATDFIYIGGSTFVVAEIL